MPDRAIGRLAANGPELSVERKPPPRIDTPARNSTCPSDDGASSSGRMPALQL
ncbi:hypothetical protein D3C72_1209560 [compost metagenome]